MIIDKLILNDKLIILEDMWIETYSLFEINKFRENEFSDDYIEKFNDENFSECFIKKDTFRYIECINNKHLFINKDGFEYTFLLLNRNHLYSLIEREKVKIDMKAHRMNMIDKLLDIDS